MRIVNGQVILPPELHQRLILGRGVEAELRAAQLEPDLHAARDELAKLKAEAKKPQPGEQSRRKPRQP